MNAACDVCNRTTSWELGTGYTADEFRRLVAGGFEPDEGYVRQAAQRGVPRELAIQHWKDDLVVHCTTGWLLCPACAARVPRDGQKPAGARATDFVLDELLTPTPARTGSAVGVLTAAAPPRHAEIASERTGPDDLRGALIAAQRPVDTSILTRVEAVLAGRDLQDAARAVLLLRLAQMTAPFSIEKARDYWARLVKVKAALPTDCAADMTALRQVLEPAKAVEAKPATGWVADALTEIEAVERLCTSDPAEAGRRLGAVEEGLKRHVLPVGKGPVRVALAGAWAGVERARAVRLLHDVPGDSRGPLLSAWNRSAPIRPEEWDLLEAGLGTPTTLSLARRLLGEDAQMVTLPQALLTAIGEQIRQAMTGQTTRTAALAEYVRLLAQPGASIPDRIALFEALFRPDWPKFDAAWASRFAWFDDLVRVGVQLGLLTSANLDRVVALTPKYAGGFVRAWHAALTVRAGGVEDALQAVRAATNGDPDCSSLYLYGAIQRGHGAEAVAAADRANKETLGNVARRVWLSHDLTRACAAISPGDVQDDPVASFLALGSARNRAEYLRRVTNRGQTALPGPLWVVPPPPRPGGMRGIFSSAKSADEVVREYTERTPLYGRRSPTSLPEAAWASEYVLALTAHSYKRLDRLLLEALVIWGDRDLAEVSATTRASLQAILPEDALMFDDALRAALLERCCTILAAEPDVLVGEFAEWVKKEWVKKGRSRKVAGQDQTLRLPREIPFRLCLTGAAAVATLSAARRDAIILRAVAVHDVNAQLMTVAARLYASDKPKLELTPPSAVARGQLAAWQTGVVEDAVGAIGAALRAGTGTESGLCDVCNAATSFADATAVGPAEFRELVEHGFEMDEGAIRLAGQFGISREQAVEGWKRDLVAGTRTGWLLCPTCAARAERVRVPA